MPPNTTASITGYVAGDDLTIIEDITNIPIGRAMTKAWFTVKNLPTDADPGLLQKVITTAPAAGVGQITDDGGTDQAGELLFLLTAADTLALGVAKIYAFDIQVKFDDGTIATMKVGSLQFKIGVTTATS